MYRWGTREATAQIEMVTPFQNFSDDMFQAPFLGDTYIPNSEYTHDAHK